MCGHHAAPRTLVGTRSAKAFTGPCSRRCQRGRTYLRRVSVLHPQD
jgi:hypothetical protein